MNLSALTLDAVTTDSANANVRVSRGGMAVKSGVKAGPFYTDLSFPNNNRPPIYAV